MLLNHFAAILIFGGPLFYIGLWMVIDPAAFAWLVGRLVRDYRNRLGSASGTTAVEAVEDGHSADSRRVRRAVRLTGVALVLAAVAV
jgi:hypothetical protein